MKITLSQFCTLIGGVALSSAAFSIDLTAQLPTRLSDIRAGQQLVELQGHPIELGQQAPEFRVVDQQFKAVSLQDFAGKPVLISVVPSVDTGTCSLQTKRFNEEVSRLPADVVMLTISTDLPFAQRRFCEQEAVDQLQVLSDAVWRDFGSNYGLLIKDMGLLARTVLLIDRNGVIRYIQQVKSLANEPDYQDALDALAKMLADS
ncbi:thiol peroxidase [Alkalimonas amylolytica]|uniref:Thiol peroxidase, atypical 2-Cys peroxiredoxin n=1 Tax=Alkalimonas amylolytica TaxID=152573 RepID=A0A1H4F7V7_ALKAM|nr:thiol peroxidase [Alkalimonas amylolytica]SEA93329.1 thiol peroxidase, atypical 2-Cys peroxiredoxin [Alkalimonas amylolytica]